MSQHHVRPLRRGPRAAAALLTCALALAGCKSAVDESESDSGTPVRGGTLSIVQSADIAPSTFLSQNNPNFAMIRTVFNTLTAYDHKTLEPQPELATSWDLSEDGTSITLKLREGVKFHSGREFTADDVIFTIQALQREDVSSQLKHVALSIDDMRADDDHTVTLHLSHPVSNLFDMLEMVPIVDKDTFDQLLAGKEFVGTGPFKVESYTPGSGVELVRNDDYWVEDRPYLGHRHQRPEPVPVDAVLAEVGREPTRPRHGAARRGDGQGRPAVRRDRVRRQRLGLLRRLQRRDPPA